LYEVNNIFKSDGTGGITVLKPEMLSELKNYTKEKEE
jgi:hypothetical protein